MIKVTVKDFAEHRGITIRSVERFIKDGTIPPAMVIKKTDKTYYIDQKKADKHLDKYSMSCILTNQRSTVRFRPASPR